MTGARVELRLFLLGGVPLGPHTLAVECVDEAARTIQTRERSPLLRRWDHLLHVEPAGPGRARYTDEVELDAGPLTPVVGALARAFFHHRHRRWRAVAQRLVSADPPPSP